MIVPQTVLLIKRAAALTGHSSRAIITSRRNRSINAVRSAIFQVLLDLGHTRNRIAEAFACDAKTVQWALDHPGENTAIITRQLASEMPFRDCGSGHVYGICPRCKQAHGYVAKEKTTAVSIGLRYSR